MVGAARNSPSTQADLEAAATEDLWTLPVGTRAQMLWDRGAHPNTDEMCALFLSCQSVGWIGALLVAAIQTGRTPNPRFYRGEQRNDPIVWPNGCPVPPPTRVRPRRPSKRAIARAMQDFDRRHGLFKLLRCGCLEECPGLEWHAEMEAAEDKRERELKEDHATWDAAREDALATARRELVDELAHATLNRPVNVDPETAGEFACLLVQKGDEP